LSFDFAFIALAVENLQNVLSPNCCIPYNAVVLSPFEFFGDLEMSFEKGAAEFT